MGFPWHILSNLIQQGQISLDVSFRSIGLLLTNRIRQQTAQKQSKQNPMRRGSLGRKGWTEKLKSPTVGREFGITWDEMTVSPESGGAEWR